LRQIPFGYLSLKLNIALCIDSPFYKYISHLKKVLIGQTEDIGA
jgi:hypothetical protein